jgi:hypothetical protein
MMPGGERASVYVARVERELRSFVSAVVKVAIRIATIVRGEKTKPDEK